MKINEEQFLQLYNEGLKNSEIHKPLDYHLNNKEYQVVLGSLLGDGCIQKHYNNGGGVLTITHCIKQYDYLKYKHTLLKNISYDIKIKQCHDKRFKNPDYQQCSFYTKSLIEFSNFRKLWYTPKKHIYFDNIKNIDPLGLAIWYMDDGHNQKDGGIRLATNSFSIPEIEILKSLLNNVFNINNISVYKDNSMYIKAIDKQKFFDIIRPFIVSCMEYKVSS